MLSDPNAVMTTAYLVDKQRSRYILLNPERRQFDAVVETAIEVIKQDDELSIGDDWVLHIPIGEYKVDIVSRKEIIASGAYDELLPE